LRNWLGNLDLLDAGDDFPLRIVAVLGCICFLTYGALIGSHPIMLMETALLPINSYRLFQLLRARPVGPGLSSHGSNRGS